MCQEVFHVHYTTRISQLVSRTCVQTPCGGRPAHDRRYGAHHRPHPRVGDAEPLERRVAAGVEEDVEGTQEACYGVHRQREQGHPGDSTGQSEGHGVEGTENQKRRETKAE